MCPMLKIFSEVNSNSGFWYRVTSMAPRHTAPKSPTDVSLSYKPSRMRGQQLRKVSSQSEKYSRRSYETHTHPYRRTLCFLLCRYTEIWEVTTFYGKLVDTSIVVNRKFDLEQVLYRWRLMNDVLKLYS